MTAVSPCAYPRCRDENNNPRLTTDTFCQPCRNRYRRLLDWLREDYAKLAVLMPIPISKTASGCRTASTSFGHPAAWASDEKAAIAAILNATESALRKHCGHGEAPSPEKSEPALVRHAWIYLTDRFEDLCTFPAAGDVAVELVDLHRRIYAGLGETRMAEKLPVPCPECDMVQMIRTVGCVYCRECGLTFPDDQYERLALIVAAETVAARDAAHDLWLASRGASL